MTYVPVLFFYTTHKFLTRDNNELADIKFESLYRICITIHARNKESPHVGSSFCIKTTLPYVDKTDGRPTLITKINEKIVVFSGKIPTCVNVAKKLEYITQNTGRHTSSF